jgi:hypothetical protein
VIYGDWRRVPGSITNDELRLSTTDYRAAAGRLRDQLLTLPDTEPIPYRSENGGDYDEHLVLRPVDVAEGNASASTMRRQTPGS